MKSFCACSSQKPVVGNRGLRLLALSNGHGEDAVAVAVLQALARHAAEKGSVLELSALPIVGRGAAYERSGFELREPRESMPSGGFLKWDPKLWREDVRAGLLGLAFKQMASIKRWTKEEPHLKKMHSCAGEGMDRTLPEIDCRLGILAVGDVVPLFMAASAGGRVPFAFIGCAKSEFYERNLDGTFFQDPSSLVSRVISPSCTYLPHERALMSSKSCRLVIPRDDLTARYLKEALPENCKDRVVSLGNPMMDGITPDDLPALEARLEDVPPYVAKVLILPGTREGEVLRNWNELLKAARVAAQLFPSITFLCPCPPSWDMKSFEDILKGQGWFMVDSQDSYTEFHLVGHNTCSLLWVCGGFGNAMQSADIALAMAGTASEQFVGLGKPVVTFAGDGPQFTEQFARLQERLLGKESLIMCANPTQAGAAIVSILQNEAYRSSCSQNGQSRMGEQGASARIAREIWSRFVES